MKEKRKRTRLKDLDLPVRILTGEIKTPIIKHLLHVTMSSLNYAKDAKYIDIIQKILFVKSVCFMKELPKSITCEIFKSVSNRQWYYY